MLIRDKKIAIAGGGPGGLTLARLLQLAGATEVKVYERDANRHVRVQGATLDLHQDSGLEALRAAKLIDAFLTHYRPGADKMCIVDNHATIFYDQHTEQGQENFDDEYFRPEIDRGPLRNMLLDSLHPDTVVWDCHFHTMTPMGNGWALQFRNGTSAKADIVIGADGANSKIRPFITAIRPFYSGVTAVEGSVYDAAVNAPAIDKLLRGGKIFAFGNDQCLIVSSKGDGSLAFYTSCKKEEGWVSSSSIDFTDKAQVFDWFRQEFATWNSIWHELFRHAQHFVPRPINCMPLDQAWDALPNATLLGDAAHLMPPFAGEGVNMAMLDALELSRCLTSHQYPDIPSAIAAYEQQMRARAAQAAQMSLENTAWMHAGDSLKNMLQMFGQ